MAPRQCAQKLEVGLVEDVEELYMLWRRRVFATAQGAVLPHRGPFRSDC